MPRELAVLEIVQENGVSSTRGKEILFLARLREFDTTRGPQGTDSKVHRRINWRISTSDAIIRTPFAIHTTGVITGTLPSRARLLPLSNRG